MAIREATWEDILPASKLLAKAFKDEPAFGDYIHPYRDEYPDDPYLFFLRFLRVEYYRRPDHVMIVSYTADESGKEERITGLAYWIRKRAVEIKPSLYNRAMIKAMESYNYLESFAYPNRAAEPSRVNVMDRVEPFQKHHWSGTRADSWYLAILGVDPACGKRGYGRQLVKYGFDRAKKEGGKENFYHACGFDVDVEMAKDAGGDENPLKDVPGGCIIFWDNGIKPEGIKSYGEA
ncbi:hypothetical protein LTR37_004218 [Vermiconidia calcicola]|uniref:Uncharacterized protein n=1 Tax=Vermiconidia calcicola TaxID=1690605 RepID=A0ACC3NMK9_9PEZI|nr:hypothetical protein LTR37_004218 [Vermiconidia calcicola]